MPSTLLCLRPAQYTRCMRQSKQNTNGLAMLENWFFGLRHAFIDAFVMKCVSVIREQVWGLKYTRMKQKLFWEEYRIKSSHHPAIYYLTIFQSKTHWDGKVHIYLHNQCYFSVLVSFYVWVGVCIMFADALKCWMHVQNPWALRC